MGASGRDFHNFLVYFKDNSYYEVVCFTAEQIPGIANRKFPKELAGRLYKKDIPIYPESMLRELVKKYKVNDIILSYSDLSHEEVMHKASIALASGASFRLMGPNDTMLKSKKPVIAICAVRTGAGKSQTSRAIGDILKEHGKKVVAGRHPMPYNKNLMEQVAERFAVPQDLKKYKTTIEEDEEYEPWINRGIPVFAGVDYKEILKQMEAESDIIIWDAGNNDLSFFKPDLLTVVTDPHRAGHELTYYPGFVNFLMADVIIINKIDSAKKEDIETIKTNIKKYNPKAEVILARSELIVDRPQMIKGRKCAVIGDGPTLTHGGMSFGAGTLAVKKYGGIIVDPRKYAVGFIKQTYEKFKHLENEIPAMGYGKKQIKELEKTINRVPCDVVVDGTPANLKALMKINKLMVEVDYELGKEAVKNLHKILKKRGFI